MFDRSYRNWYTVIGNWWNLLDYSLMTSGQHLTISSCVSDYVAWQKTTRRQRNYNPICMDLAVSSVLTGKMNPTQAAREFHVPRQTIVNRLNKRYWKSVVTTPGSDLKQTTFKHDHDAWFFIRIINPWLTWWWWIIRICLVETASKLIDFIS